MTREEVVRLATSLEGRDEASNSLSSTLGGLNLG